MDIALLIRAAVILNIVIINCNLFVYTDFIYSVANSQQTLANCILALTLLVSYLKNNSGRLSKTGVLEIS